MRVFIVLAVLIVAGFVFIPDIFDSVILAPCNNDFFLYKFLTKVANMCPLIPGEFNKPIHVEIINIKLASQFFLNITLAFWLALLVTFPYLIYEIWRFVCPALYENEKKRSAVGIPVRYDNVLRGLRDRVFPRVPAYVEVPV